MKKFAALALAGAVPLVIVGVVTEQFQLEDPDPASETVVSGGPSTLRGTRFASPIEPIPFRMDLDPAVVELGSRLFHDPLLSSDGTISCSSCHDLSKGGDDGKKVSTGVDGRQGLHNAPTVLNSAFNFRQFWNGRADSLEDQIDGPIQNPLELNTDWESLIERIDDDGSYDVAFQKAFGHGPDRESVEKSIAEFERALITPGSPFDRYLYGDETAISEEALKGYKLFINIGCASCHQGVNVGGNMFQHLGKMADFFAERGGVAQSDYGRFNVTGKERDRFKFKVPSLRNIAKTAPYFHDGSIPSLRQAVRIMGRYQLGENLTDEEVTNLISFLRSLSGELLPELGAKR